MPKYQVTLIMPNSTATIECPDRDYILDIAEDSGIDLPYSCRVGGCYKCIGRIKDGSVNQQDQTILENKHLADNWVLTCAAYPKSNCTIITHQEDEFLN
uniref:Ferredoxin n=1 Tax=Plocamium cartilagineum TaxID=31452 RepID=A0A1C9CHY6_PLOCA|nr:ferredoxin [Plocamium cartilagineum]AOM68004.1 ferredoxin [Plocamium cartilagineum]